MAKQLLKKYPKYLKKVFDSIITGDESSVHFYETKRKVYKKKKIWAMKQAKKPTIAKQILTEKKVLYASFFSNLASPMRIAVPKGSVCLVVSIIMRKARPKSVSRISMFLFPKLLYSPRPSDVKRIGEGHPTNTPYNISFVH